MLQAAYGDASLTFDNIRVPRDKLLGPVVEVSGLMYWQSARENQALRDYLELQRDLWHKRFRQVMTAMKEAADRKVLIFPDALKQTMAGWNLHGFFGSPQLGGFIPWYLAYPEVNAGSGHIAVAELLGENYFDGIFTPHDYAARGIGGVYEQEGIVDSAVLRGKYFMGEMDTRLGDGIGGVRNEKEFDAIFWRNFADGFTRGYNSSWNLVDRGDWLNNNGPQKTIQRIVETVRESINWPHETMPGIAMIIDDSAVLETNGSGNFHNEAVMWGWKMGLRRCGVPLRIYLFEDLALDNFPKHRVFYFPNLYRVDDARLELLKKKVFRDGNVVVWGPGSGISNGKNISPESAAKLTGFNFEMYPVNNQRRIIITNFEHSITRDLEADTIYGGSLSYGPILLPEDGIELGMAWVPWGMPRIGLALKEFGKGASNGRNIKNFGEGDYASVFTIAVQLPAGLWRNIARYAGAHVYCESNDILMADKSIVGLHSVKTGQKKITLPGKYRVTDIITGKVYSKKTRKINFDLKAPETRVFLLEK